MDTLIANEGWNKLMKWSNKLLANRAIKYSDNPTMEKNILLWLEFMSHESKRLSNNFRNRIKK